MPECSSDVKYSSYQYRLRAATPMPVQGNGNFVVHTFMAEKYEIDVYLYTRNLVGSSQFRGQGGNLMSASYNRLSDLTGEAFSGKVVYEPEIVEEDSFGGPY